MIFFTSFFSIFNFKISLRQLTMTLFYFVSLTLQVRAQETASLELVEVSKIWDKAPHNAFTDLIRYKDRWFCIFRESSSHTSPDGSLRIITSANGINWESAAHIKSPDSDLRDAKLSITPNGQLMMYGAKVTKTPLEKRHQTMAWFSEDGYNWGKEIEIADQDIWLWRISRYKNKAYGFGYHCGENKSLRFYSTKNGKKFKTLIPLLLDNGYPNETSIVFKDKTAYCLLRRDPDPGMLGISKPPFRDWKWNDLGIRIGGPHMIILPNGRFLAAVRLYDGMTRTSLCWIDPEKSTIKEAMALPSGGDTSYPGLVWHEGMLWISYYSSHEGKTSIYLAKVKLN